VAATLLRRLGICIPLIAALAGTARQLRGVLTMRIQPTLQATRRAVPSGARALLVAGLLTVGGADDSGGQQPCL